MIKLQKCWPFCTTPNAHIWNIFLVILPWDIIYKIAISTRTKKCPICLYHVTLKTQMCLSHCSTSALENVQSTFSWSFGRTRMGITLHCIKNIIFCSLHCESKLFYHIKYPFLVNWIFSCLFYSNNSNCIKVNRFHCTRFTFGNVENTFTK